MDEPSRVTDNPTSIAGLTPERWEFMCEHEEFRQS